MDTVQLYKQELDTIKNKAYIDKHLCNVFSKRISRGKLTRQENPTDHFCSMLLLVDKSKKTVLLGHHVKANAWIPIGGHADANEAPVETMRRELREELQINAANVDIELFDLATFTLDTAHIYTCAIHYDFWYLAYHPEVTPVFDKTEFYDMRWVPLEEAITLTVKPEYKIIMKHLNEL